MQKQSEPVPFINHCPNRKCIWYNPNRLPKESRWYRLHGYYNSAQHERIPRFRCLRCGTTFSARTGRSTHYLHFDDIEFSDVGERYLAGASLCEIARDHGVSVQMIRIRLHRFFGHEAEAS
ncbi:MAG: hypothetical protein IJS84_02995 [Spirochaetales bacterium]|nr:hypothetical protein [Spirochaetales bacterium]MBR1582168.1 hypothetical protein [Spirochaetales bacterium]